MHPIDKHSCAPPRISVVGVLNPKQRLAPPVVVSLFGKNSDDVHRVASGVLAKLLGQKLTAFLHQGRITKRAVAMIKSVDFVVVVGDGSSVTDFCSDFWGIEPVTANLKLLA